MLSIYIHIPFCIKKCSYCDFVSFVDYENKIDNYIDGLEKEIVLSTKINEIKNKEVGTIFFGGGTPSILSVKQLEKILQNIKNNFCILENCEITIEVNPATDINFAEIQKNGFNRVSIGVQSFNDNELSFLERLHNSKIAENTIEKAKKYFDNISIDLIYGIPNQTLQSFENTLNKAMALKLKHISAYNLEYKENTKLGTMHNNNNVIKPSVELEIEMYEMLCSKLKNNTFYQYEVSNFAVPNYECKHNQNYWHRVDYIGFGIAAHSCLSNIRFSNTDNLQTYFQCVEQNKLPITSSEKLTDKNIYEEKIFLGLRSDGINENLLNDKQMQFMKECIKFGFAIKNGKFFVLTTTGKFITDTIVLKVLEKM